MSQFESPSISPNRKNERYTLRNTTMAEIIYKNVDNLQLQTSIVQRRTFLVTIKLKKKYNFPLVEAKEQPLDNLMVNASFCGVVAWGMIRGH